MSATAEAESSGTAGAMAAALTAQVPVDDPVRRAPRAPERMARAAVAPPVGRATPNVESGASPRHATVGTTVGVCLVRSGKVRPAATGRATGVTIADMSGGTADEMTDAMTDEMTAAASGGTAHEMTDEMTAGMTDEMTDEMTAEMTDAATDETIAEASVAALAGSGPLTLSVAVAPA